MLNISLIKDGNEKAFKQLYDLFHVKLFHYFLKRKQPHHIARELTQCTFIKIWQYRLSLTESCSIDTQVFTTANSVLIDHIRMEARQAQISVYTPELPDHEAAPQVQTFEKNNYIHTYISQLPPVRKKVIELKLVHGYSNKEIAHQLSMAVKTVEDHITKAVRTIKTLRLFL
ncbi:MAG: RNA polymerase sigma factor [Chitinophaga sp.]|uniref:RNA polymerase sigma factor n=1 Tax=Chitinophaga sp. TaxID=1869181 RepID=UPI001B072C78|nr:RNA polymerase sigma factor [Chitinophaga sp.]MBO9727989.1 RNA polymerase sigma factor [Chitinophaga sp.]